METGEHVIAAAGGALGALHRGPSREVAKIDLKVSPPLVSFRRASHDGIGDHDVKRLLTIKATAAPLPSFFPRVVEDSADELKQILLSAHQKAGDTRTRSSLILWAS